MAAERIDVLAARVRWLDRYRRPLALVMGALGWVLASREVAELVTDAWPAVIPVFVGALFAAVVWWVVEVVFAWMIAMWETEHERLSRDRGLPRAQLRRVRRRKT